MMDRQRTLLRQTFRDEQQQIHITRSGIVKWALIMARDRAEEDDGEYLRVSFGELARDGPDQRCGLVVEP